MTNLNRSLRLILAPGQHSIAYNLQPVANYSVKQKDMKTFIYPFHYLSGTDLI